MSGTRATCYHGSDHQINGTSEKEEYDMSGHESEKTVLVGDTYETPADAAEYAAAEREALASLGDPGCAAELEEADENKCGESVGGGWPCVLAPRHEGRHWPAGSEAFRATQT